MGIVFKTWYTEKSIKFLLREIYTKDGVQYELLRNGTDAVPLSTLEQTKDLKTVTNNGFMMAIPVMFNKSKKFKRKRSEHIR